LTVGRERGKRGGKVREKGWEDKFLGCGVALLVRVGALGHKTKENQTRHGDSTK